jgi:AraC-like DNA-binding protein
MIYREMPATWDPAFRPRFYARWGHENAVISASTRSVEYPEYRQLLSIKAASGGEEEYFVDGRRIAVDDDSFLILNANRTYGSRVRSLKPVHSFTIFFRPGLVEDVRRALTISTARLLDSTPDEASVPVEFAEQLRPHDRCITPVLRHIHRHVAAGDAEELWIEEQLHFLLARMLRLPGEDRVAAAAVPSARAATRKELYRRLGLGLTFMQSHYRQPIGLAEIAAASRLSRFHLLRTFKAVHGVTPSVYLNRKRIRAACRLLATSSMSVTAVADAVGFGTRSTLFRQLRAAGISQAALRRTTRTRPAATPADPEGSPSALAGTSRWFD